MEITHIRDHQLGPEGVNVHNPAFDVTPHQFITAIITDKGVARPPYIKSLKTLTTDLEATVLPPVDSALQSLTQPHFRLVPEKLLRQSVVRQAMPHITDSRLEILRRHVMLPSQIFQLG